jgi:4-amino-4-deoxy-L-arabinose transferase-like glycosyltransferase
VTYFAGLGRPAIGDSDEAFYAEAGREMLASGDWLTPHYNYDVRFQKPILLYWLIAASYAALGVTEAAARTFPALSGLALSLLTAAIARRWYDELTARDSGLIAATAFGYFSIGRLALPDLPLALTTTLSIWAVLRASLEDERTPGRWWLIAGAACGAGVLIKGPVAIVLLLLVSVPILWLERGRARVPARGLVGASGVAALIAAPWYLAMIAVHGTPYVSSFFVADNLERFATTRFNAMRPPWFYLPILAGGLLPWTPVAVCCVAPAATWLREKTTRTTESWRLLIWLLLPLAFFTLSIGKQPRYILPVLPPLAILLARGFVRASDDRMAGRILRVAALMVALFLAVLGLLLYRARPVVVTVEPWLVLASAGVILASGVGLAVAALRVRLTAVPLAVGIAGAITLGGLQYGLAPAGRDPVQLMGDLVLTERQPAVPVATYHAFVRNLVFYAGIGHIDLSTEAQLRAFIARPEPVLCVIPARELERVGRTQPLNVRTLGEVEYLDASPVKLRALFASNPARSLQRVLLVTNVRGDTTSATR